MPLEPGPDHRKDCQEQDGTDARDDDQTDHVAQQERPDGTETGPEVLEEEEKHEQQPRHPQRHRREFSLYVWARWSCRTAWSGAGCASTEAAKAGNQSAVCSSVKRFIACSRSRKARAASGQRWAATASRSISATVFVTVRGRPFLCVSATSFQAFSKLYSAIAIPFDIARTATTKNVRNKLPDVFVPFTADYPPMSLRTGRSIASGLSYMSMSRMNGR